MWIEEFLTELLPLQAHGNRIACFYDIDLCISNNTNSLCKFPSCYNNCIKLFSGYKKYDNVTKILLEIERLRFDTVCNNARFNFHAMKVGYTVKIRWCVRVCCLLNLCILSFHSACSVSFSIWFFMCVCVCVFEYFLFMFTILFYGPCCLISI